MEFVKRLVAFHLALDQATIILLTDPDTVAGTWIMIVNSPDETTMVTALDPAARELYQRWVDRYFGGQPGEKVKT